MDRTTSVLALGLFLGLAPIGALAQTQTDDTQQQMTQPSQSEESTETKTLDTDQQSTETETPQTDDQQQTETETLQTDDQQQTETETPQADDQQQTGTETLQTDDQQQTETEVIQTDEQQQTETLDAEEPDADTAAGSEEVIPAQEESEMLASSLMGASVNLADESIGTVSDLIIGEDHTIKGVVVGVGGFLGIGEKRVALPMDKITVQPTEEAGEVELAADTTREELEAQEEFKTAADIQAEEEAAQTEQQMQTQPGTAPAVPQQ